MKFLLEKGAGVNATSNDENTPLHLAAESGNYDNVAELLEGGAHISLPNDDGNTPVDLAGKNNHKNVMRLFLENGKNIRNNTELLGTIIKYALLFNSEEVRPDYVVNNNELSKLWNDCPGEVERMQGRMLGNSTISLYQFLRETDENKLAGYLSGNNIGVREYFETVQYEGNFPTYAGMIKEQFSKARERKDLLDRSHIIMDRSDDLKKFSQEVKGKITNHLENEDLRNIIEAPFSAPNQNLDSPNAEQLQGSDLAR